MSPTPQSLTVSSMVVVEGKRAERLAETSWMRYLEKVRKTELGLDSREKTRGDKRTALK